VPDSASEACQAMAEFYIIETYRSNFDSGLVLSMAKEDKHVILGKASVTARPNTVRLYYPLIAPSPYGINVDIQEFGQFTCCKH
jgi:hypothetical protein